MEFIKFCCTAILLLKALWTKNGSCIVYPCHAIIVSIEVSSGQQQFFTGHTEKVKLKSQLLQSYFQKLRKPCLLRLGNYLGY